MQQSLTVMCLAAWWLARRRPASRVLARLAVGLVPTFAFGIGHLLARPWLPEGAREGWRLARGLLGA